MTDPRVDQLRDFVYPCEKSSCLSYQEIVLNRLCEKTDNTTIPSHLMSCLFCIYFEHFDMYASKDIILDRAFKSAKKPKLYKVKCTYCDGAGELLRMTNGCPLECLHCNGFGYRVFEDRIERKPRVTDPDDLQLIVEAEDIE